MVAFDFIYLASQSPRRRELLNQLGVRHELLLPGPDEDAEALEALREGEGPEHYVLRVTRAKVQAAQARLAQRMASQGLTSAPVLCSDTTVALGQAILGKPADDADAAAMLARLSGRLHRVLTAVAVAHEGRVEEAVHTAQVDMRPIAPEDIARYVASAEPRGKAGAYAIQGRAAEWVRSIHGSHSGIMGLPLFETADLLRRFGVQF